jgi:hypothetical protein
MDIVPCRALPSVDETRQAVRFEETRLKTRRSRSRRQPKADFRAANSTMFAAPKMSCLRPITRNLLSPVLPADQATVPWRSSRRTLESCLRKRECHRRLRNVGRAFQIANTLLLERLGIESALAILGPPDWTIAANRCRHRVLAKTQEPLSQNESHAAFRGSK